VERAEDLGMIAGVRGRASDLREGTLLADLRTAGVDHVTFLYATPDAALHDQLCGAGEHAAALEVLAWLEANQVCAVAEVPLVQANLYTLEETVAALLPLGADNLSFVAYVTTDAELAARDGIFTAEAMTQVAAIVEEATESAHAHFIWDPPVQRNPAFPLTAQIQAGPRCSGDIACASSRMASAVCASSRRADRTRALATCCTIRGSKSGTPPCSASTASGWKARRAATSARPDHLRRRLSPRNRRDGRRCSSFHRRVRGARRDFFFSL
jgi:hypothetical protein